MAWEVFSIIGTIAFAISGAIIAMEEEYDLFGVYILGIVTAFGGGAIRNLLIGLPVTTLWGQDMMFQIALATLQSFLFFRITLSSTGIAGVISQMPLVYPHLQFRVRSMRSNSICPSVPLLSPLF